MKKFIVLMLSVQVAMASVLYAQETKPEKADTEKNKTGSLFSIGDISLSGFGGIFTTVGKVGEEAGVFVGGRGAVIINSFYFIGAGGSALVGPHSRSDITGQPLTDTFKYVNMGYGGGILGLNFFQRNVINFSVSALIGGGRISLAESGSSHRKSGNNGGDKFFVIEPAVIGYVNLTRWCRVGLGATYRYVNGITIAEFNDKDFRSINGIATVEFGWF